MNRLYLLFRLIILFTLLGCHKDKPSNPSIRIVDNIIDSYSPIFTPQSSPPIKPLEPPTNKKEPSGGFNNEQEPEDSPGGWTGGGGPGVLCKTNGIIDSILPLELDENLFKGDFFHPEDNDTIETFLFGKVLKPFLKNEKSLFFAKLKEILELTHPRTWIDKEDLKVFYDQGFLKTFETTLKGSNCELVQLLVRKAPTLNEYLLSNKTLAPKIYKNKKLFDEISLLPHSLQILIKSTLWLHEAFYLIGFWGDQHLSSERTRIIVANFFKKEFFKSIEKFYTSFYEQQLDNYFKIIQKCVYDRIDSKLRTDCESPIFLKNYRTHTAKIVNDFFIHQSLGYLSYNGYLKLFQSSLPLEERPKDDIIDNFENDLILNAISTNYQNYYGLLNKIFEKRFPDDFGISKVYFHITNIQDIQSLFSKNPISGLISLSELLHPTNFDKVRPKEQYFFSYSDSQLKLNENELLNICGRMLGDQSYLHTENGSYSPPSVTSNQINIERLGELIKIIHNYKSIGFCFAKFEPFVNPNIAPPLASNSGVSYSLALKTLYEIASGPDYKFNDKENIGLKIKSKSIINSQTKYSFEYSYASMNLNDFEYDFERELHEVISSNLNVIKYLSSFLELIEGSSKDPTPFCSSNFSRQILDLYNEKNISYNSQSGNVLDTIFAIYMAKCTNVETILNEELFINVLKNNVDKNESLIEKNMLEKYYSDGSFPLLIDYYISDIPEGLF